MTEERFYIEDKYVMQDGEVYVICSGEHNADVVATVLNELLDENKKLKQFNQEAIELIHDGIVEMHDGKRDYAEKLFNKAIKVIKNEITSEVIEKGDFE